MTAGKWDVGMPIGRLKMCIGSKATILDYDVTFKEMNLRTTDFELKGYTPIILIQLCKKGFKGSLITIPQEKNIIYVSSP